MSTTDIYLVRHAESCNNITHDKWSTYRRRHRDILHEPGLSLKGYIQSFMLRDHILKKIKYDKVICSPLLRTVVTALISLSTFDGEANRNVVHIVPYLKFHSKKLSKVNDTDELKKKIHEFKLWFHTRGIHLYQLFRDLNPRYPKNITTIHFPRVDYSALEDYEHRFRENDYIDVMRYFRDIISKINVSSLLVFTHKRFIMKIQTFNSIYTAVPANTSITKIIHHPNTDDEFGSKKIVYTPRLGSTLKIGRKPELEMCRTRKRRKS